jgi:hypothetical protein
MIAQEIAEMPAVTSRRISFLALTGAILGLLFVTGPIAIVFGWLGLRAVNRSDGRLAGAGLAIFGMIAGLISVVLLGLGTVAIVLQTLREQSNRVECVNNLRVIGLAVNAAADQGRKTCPLAVLPLPERPPEEHLSWLAGLLPLMEPGDDSKPSVRQPVAAQLQLDQPWNDPANLKAGTTKVRHFRCPSHGLFAPPDEPALTDYVGITGIGANAATLPATDPDAGFFGYDRIIRMEDVKAGASCTFLALETTLDNGPWIAGGPPTARGVDATEKEYIGIERPFGGSHRNGAIDILTAVYVDASVQHLTSNVNPRVFRNAARIAGDPEAK